MAQYRYTRQSKIDLESIIKFSAQHWGLKRSETYMDGLQDLVSNLADFPDLGLDNSHYINGLLSFPYQSHSIYYIKQPHGIDIIRILHNKMNPHRHLSWFRMGKAQVSTFQARCRIFTFQF